MWNEPIHPNQCYLCAVTLTGVHWKNRPLFPYPNNLNVVPTIPRTAEDILPTPQGVSECSDIEMAEDFAEQRNQVISSVSESPESSSEMESCEAGPSSNVSLHASGKLSTKFILELICELQLPKNKGQILMQRLQEQNVLKDKVFPSTQRHREQTFTPFFWRSRR